MYISIQHTEMFIMKFFMWLDFFYRIKFQWGFFLYCLWIYISILKCSWQFFFWWFDLFMELSFCGGFFFCRACKCISINKFYNMQLANFFIFTLIMKRLQVYLMLFNIKHNIYKVTSNNPSKKASLSSTLQSSHWRFCFVSGVFVFVSLARKQNN